MAISDEDKKAWEEFTRSVSKIKFKERNLPPRPKPIPHRVHPAYELPPTFQFDRRFKRGKLTIEGVVDLHGLTQAEAFSELRAFITQAYQGGKKCVLVITGKGIFREGGGILRAQLPLWLERPEFRRIISALHPAHIRDGGEGAFYVILKTPSQLA